MSTTSSPITTRSGFIRALASSRQPRSTTADGLLSSRRGGKVWSTRNRSDDRSIERARRTQMLLNSGRVCDKGSDAARYLERSSSSPRFRNSTLKLPLGRRFLLLLPPAGLTKSFPSGSRSPTIGMSGGLGQTLLTNWPCRLS